jgi:heme oxygenase
MLQDRLKSVTKVNHDELESLMFVNEIMNKTLSVEQYKIVLTTNYIIHAELESGLHEHLSADLRDKLQIGNRSKLVALQQDLDEMQIRQEELEALDLSFLQIDASNAASLGAMYVLEGATLGGHVIYKKLKANPAFENLSLNYYSVYQQNLMPNWLSFVDVINTNVPESEFETAEHAALQMFNHIADVSRTVKSSFIGTPAL